MVKICLITSSNSRLGLSKWKTTMQWYSSSSRGSKPDGLNSITISSTLRHTATSSQLKTARQKPTTWAEKLSAWDRPLPHQIKRATLISRYAIERLRWQVGLGSPRSLRHRTKTNYLMVTMASIVSSSRCPVMLTLKKLQVQCWLRTSWCMGKGVRMH